METIVLRQKANAEGALTIQVPARLRDAELDVVVILQPVVPAEEPAVLPETAAGWPPHFFEATYGSLADDPIERLPQGAYEVREPLP